MLKLCVGRNHQGTVTLVSGTHLKGLRFENVTVVIPEGVVNVKVEGCHFYWRRTFIDNLKIRLERIWRRIRRIIAIVR